MTGMMRNSLLSVGVFLLASLIVEAAQDDLVVRVKAGLLRGRMQETTRAFLGIPYAAPPVGKLRWAPPQPALAWEGVRAATEFGAHPWQPSLFKDMIFRDAGPSEDCLTLNVWTPANSAEAKLPVMVWIYGGGFFAGGTSEQRQDGARLAARGVVVVSMNYRLGVFGFFAHPELIAESPQHAAGNYGLMDQLAALQWVQDNIAAFGGDPKNVTIFGESAGSASVSALMASPRAKGTFHKAIGESGSLFSLGGLVLKPVAERAKEDADYVGQVSGAHTLAELRALPAEKLLEAVTKGPGVRADYWFAPNIDGEFLTATMTECFARGGQNDVPLLAGWNHDEGGLPGAAKGSPIEALQRTARDEFGADAEEFLRLYPADTTERAARSRAEFGGDKFIGFSTWAWLEAQVNTGREPVYRFRFDRAPPTDFAGHPRGAFHSAEIIYVFGAFDAQPQVPWTDTDRAVSALMQTYWTNFARTGNPNGTGLPAWPRYSADTTWSTVILDQTAAARPDDLRNRYLFLAKHWSK